MKNEITVRIFNYFLYTNFYPYPVETLHATSLRKNIHKQTTNKNAQIN